MIDFVYRRPDGTRARHRKDAQVQTVAAATAEERRLLAALVTTGAPTVPTAPTTTPTRPAPERQGPTFGEIVQLYRAGPAVALKPSVRSSYGRLLDSRLVPRWKDTPVASIGYDAVVQIDAELVGEGLSASSRRNLQVTLRSVLRYAYEAGHLSAFPRLPELPTAGKTILKTLTDEDVSKILAASSPRAKVAIGLAAYAGLRAGEVRALRWSDVDLVARNLVVRLSTSKGETSTPKSGHEREIPLAEPLFQLLKGGGKGLVALTSDGEPWGEYGLIQVLKRACKRAGIQGSWRFHDLRHFFVTRLFRGGAPATTVQALAGHASLVVTQRYAHVGRSDLRAAIDLLPR